MSIVDGGTILSGDASINRGNQTSGELLIGGTTDGGFVDFDGSNLQLNTQRDPNTGTFINTSKSNASMTMSGANGASSVKFGTAAANNTTATERLVIGSTEMVVNDDSNDYDFRVESNGNTHMFFLDGGNDQIMIGSSTANDEDSGFFDTNGIYSISRASGTGRNMLIFRNGGSGVGTITTSASATQYNTSSDARLKDVTGKARGLEIINALNPVAYNWKADGNADEGLIAQEVMDIVPNAVSGSEEDMYQMDYSKLVVHLVAGMKEQQELITTLQAEVALLKEK